VRLYLVQHGKARPKDEDPDRPLTDEGREDVQRVGARLAAGTEPPEIRRIVHSGKTRARETAQELAEIVRSGASAPSVAQSDALGPTDDPSTWADRARSGEADGTMLVGHLPYMERIAASLVEDDAEAEVVTFSKGGVLCVGSDGDDGGWTVRWCVTPGVA